MKSKTALILLAILLATAGLVAINALGVPALGERYDDDGNRRLMWGVGNIRQGLDLMGGVSILYEAEMDGTPATTDMNAAQALLRGRLDRRGYTEADVAQEGARQLRVDIPGVEDAETAVAEIGATAMLTFMGDDELSALWVAHNASVVWEDGREVIRGFART